MKYKILEDIAIADIAFEVYGKTLEELFTNSAIATFETMASLKNVQQKVKKQIKLEAENEENLLFDFIEELIFLKDADYLLLSKFKVKITKNKKLHLEATVSGEKINPKKHKLLTDVKAITYHMFNVKKEKGKWVAKIILDI